MSFEEFVELARIFKRARVIMFCLEPKAAKSNPISRKWRRGFKQFDHCKFLWDKMLQSVFSDLYDSDVFYGSTIIHPDVAEARKAAGIQLFNTDNWFVDQTIRIGDDD